MEASGMRRLRQRLNESDLGPDADPSSVSAVFEQLSANILTDKWEPKRVAVRVGQTMAAFLSLLLSFELTIFAPLLAPSVPPAFLIGSALSLWGGFAATWALSKQLDWAERLLLALPGSVAFLAWGSLVAPLVLEHEISPSSFVLLAINFVAATSAVLGVLAPYLGWRILGWVGVMWRWLTYGSSSVIRLKTIERASAWLWLMAPNRNSGFGWMSIEEVTSLSEAASVERQGASWRGLIIPLAAVIGLANFGGHLIDRFSPRDNPISLSWANPVVFAIALAVVLSAWGAVLDMWLGEFPNRIIGLACVEVCYHLQMNGDHPRRRYGNYRVITVENKAAASKRFNALRSSWIMVGAEHVCDNLWRCLLRRKA
jgi:hypothetical protein